ncbi:TylF/MycF/NovP-related O-methyltransferase [Rhodoferax saidenbachensis]|uniref:Macrocin O-methyltransferase n=1 Tax=Rhodoferax saidenbachensis TaxID=1484693 RepID=A0A1P8KED0_9BURK|nr:TylF/MycF/NovP-related O-methyltransferase [Rhodoferax saidenbachensis]APW44326.1 hypothetical protein RS694_18560 [Rhodoferax saidenbachensis]
MLPTAFDLYWLKRSITATLDASEPDAEAGGARFIVDFLQHYINGSAISMVPLARLDQLQHCIEDVICRQVPGDLMEAGVWRGGTAVLMRAVLKAHGIADRCVWAADSFEGLPEPDAECFPKEAAAHQGPVMREGFGHFAADLDAVKANFARYGLLDSQVRFLPGWFKDTLPIAPVQQLAVLRLDADYHESTKVCLDNLYDKLSVGGYLIVDDYGEDAWTYCRTAVDDFRAERRIADPMIRVDSRCWYWMRTQ